MEEWGTIGRSAPAATLAGSGLCRFCPSCRHCRMSAVSDRSEDMYLIHAHLGPPSAVMPESAIRLVQENSSPIDGLEHVSINFDTLTIGLFISAPTTIDAERAGARICRRMLETCPEFTGLVLVSCRATVVPDYFDRELGFEL